MSTLTTPTTTPVTACPPSESECEHLTQCDVCSQALCLAHSDGLDLHGSTDPVMCERYGICHRACHREACRSALCAW